jgi:Ran GTPase-activating protein (RanGAP) involved in mRNA processing and transport
VLGNFTALVHLDLSGNVLGAEGAQSLLGVLVHSTTLAHLDLSFNEMGSEGAESLMMLLQCTALTHIILDHNFIDRRVLRALGADRRGRDRRRHSAQKN